MLDQITHYFESLDFTVISLQETERHLVGQLTYNDSSYFMKLAINEQDNPLTAKEYKWLSLFSDEEIEGTSLINVPQPFQTGTYDEQYWYTCQFIKGQPLASLIQLQNTALLEKNLTGLAQIASDIMLFQSPGKPTSVLPKQKNLTKIINRLQNWLDQSSYQAIDIWERLKPNLKYLQKAPRHGALVPWNVLADQSDTLYLIDWKSAKREGYKFYDVAYCYHSIYTKLMSPTLANTFLAEFLSLYQSTNRLDLDCLYWMIGERIMGGYLDIAADDLTGMELHHKLREHWFTHLNQWQLLQ